MLVQPEDCVTVVDVAIKFIHHVCRLNTAGVTQC